MAEEDDQLTPMRGESNASPIITRRKYAGLSGLTGDTVNGGMKRLLESNSQRLERIGIKTEKDQEQRLASIATAMTLQSLAPQPQSQQAGGAKGGAGAGDDESISLVGLNDTQHSANSAGIAAHRPSNATVSSMPSLSEFTASSDTFPIDTPTSTATTTGGGAGGLLGSCPEEGEEPSAEFDFNHRSSSASRAVEGEQSASMEILQDNARSHRESSSQEILHNNNNSTATKDATVSRSAGSSQFMYDMCSFEIWDDNGGGEAQPGAAAEARESFEKSKTETEGKDTSKNLELSRTLSSSGHQTNNNNNLAEEQSESNNNGLEELPPPSPKKIRTRSIDLDLFDDASSDFFVPKSSDHGQPSSSSSSGPSSSEHGPKPPASSQRNVMPSVYPAPTLDIDEDDAAEKKKEEEQKKKDAIRRKRSGGGSRSPSRKMSSAKGGRSSSPTSWSRDNKSPLSRPAIVDRTSSTGGRGRSTSTKRTDSTGGGGVARSKSSNPSSLGRKGRMAKRASSQPGLDSSCSSIEGGGGGGGIDENRRGRRKSSSVSPENGGGGGRSERKASIMGASERGAGVGNRRRGGKDKQGNKDKEKGGSFDHDEFQNYVNSYFEKTNMGESVARLMLEDFVIKKKIEKATGADDDNNKKGGRGRGRGRASSATRSSSLAARGRARSSSKSPLNSGGGGGGGGGAGRSPGPALQRTKSRSLSPDKTRSRGGGGGSDHSSTRETRRGGSSGGGGGVGGGISHSTSGVGMRRQQLSSEGDLLNRSRGGRSLERPSKNFSYDRKPKQHDARKEGYARRRARHDQRRHNDRAALESYMTTKAEEDAKEALEEAIEEVEEAEKDDSSELKQDDKREGKLRNSAAKMGKMGVQVIKKTNKVTQVGKGVKKVGKLTLKTSKVVGKNTVGRTTQFLTNRLVKNDDDDGKEALRKSGAVEPKPPGKYNTLPDLEPIDLEKKCDEAFAMLAT